MKIIIREQYLNLYHHVICNYSGPGNPPSKCKRCIGHFRVFPRNSKLQNYKFSNNIIPNVKCNAEIQVKLL